MAACGYARQRAVTFGATTWGQKKTRGHRKFPQWVGSRREIQGHEIVPALVLFAVTGLCYAVIIIGRTLGSGGRETTRSRL